MRQVSFGPFTLDVQGAELRKDGERVALRPKCFDVLVYLVESGGRVVSKEELMERVWSDVVVNDGTVTRTVAELRSALDDRFVETVARRGFKFAGAAPLARSGEFALVHGTRQHVLTEGEHLIGRGADVAIPVYDAGTSRHHARVFVNGDTLTIEDLASRNGTFVNGKPVAGVIALHSGDEIRIGSDRLVVWSRAGETEPLS
jgi:hypothetical protein